MFGHGGVAVTVVVAALVAGCNVPPDSAPSPPGEGPEPPTHTRPVFTVGEALAELPASARDPGAKFTMLVGDLARATELGGFSRPEDPADASAWVSSLNGAMVDGEPPPVYVPLAVPLAPSVPAALVEKDLGWSIVDVDHFVSWTSRPQTTTVVAGNLDAQTLAGLPETRGISSAGTGPDLTGDLQQASPVRPQGIPLRMAVEDERLIASPLTPVVKDWRNGSQRTLADDPVLSDLAAVLDEAGAVSAMITSAKSLGQSLPPQAVLDQLREESGGIGFAEFDTYAIGWTVEGDQPRFVVAYHTTGDTDLAVDQIAARWEGIDYRGQDMSAFVEVTDIEAAGDIVVVTGKPAPDKSGEALMLKSEASDLPFVTGFNPGRAASLTPSGTAPDSCDLLSHAELVQLADDSVSEANPGLTGGLANCQWTMSDGRYIQAMGAPASDWARALPEILRAIEASGQFSDAENLGKLRRFAKLVAAGHDLDSKKACSLFSAMVEMQGQPAGIAWGVSVFPSRQEPQAVTGQMCSGGRFTSVMIAAEAGQLDEPLPVEQVVKALKAAHRRGLR